MSSINLYASQPENPAHLAEVIMRMDDANATLNGASIKPPASLRLLGQLKINVAWFLPELLSNIS
ncbi:hypothetical protein VCV18_003314 [Metarhizium anisopliae]